MNYALNYVLMTIVCSQAYAGQEEIACPATILASTTIASNAGWEPVGGAAEYKLEHAQVYSGHPSDEVPLTPEERQKGKELIAQWRLKPEQAEFWIGCAYRDTTVVLARKLDPRLSQCVARYGQGSNTPPGQLQSLTCL